MHEYIVIINDFEIGQHFIYTYGSVKNVELSVDSKGGRISFTMNVRKTHEDFLDFRIRLFRDAYRKIHQLYAVMFSRGLEVKRLCISIDGYGTV